MLLPIGISFFTFHAISYVVDVYRRDAVAQKGPVDAALYLLLFPQLIAGPIVRYRDIAAQLTARVARLDDFAEGVRRFVIGLAKKMLIANTSAGPADAHLRHARRPSSPPRSPGSASICYTLQIYFDFSGYSDMAIGLGRMFGFSFPENFHYPYVATSVHDFWRRWHISLSTWFRDYLYIPLGGNRVRAVRVYLNLVDRVLPVRPVARGELDVRRLGPVPRRVPGARAARAGARCSARLPRAASARPTRCWS